MSALLFLTDEDFFVGKGTKGPILCTNIPGFSLLLFYSNKCPHCKALDPIFRSLPGTIQGCQFGMININTNFNCVRLSKSTISPITYVPSIILYVNGRPFMRFVSKTTATREDLTRFVLEVGQKLQNQHKFSAEDGVKEDPRGKIPEFTVGHPLFGDDEVTYLEFAEAYPGK